MGIPSYFSYIVKNHPKIIKKYFKNVLNVDNLYLDCNSIIYDAYSRITFDTLTESVSLTIINAVIKKIEEYACKYCGQIYKHKSSIYKHIKYSCMQNKDEDLKELVRLLNLQLDQKEKEMEMQRKQIDCQTKQIEKLMGKLEINGSFNTTNNIQNKIFSTHH